MRGEVNVEALDNNEVVTLTTNVVQAYHVDDQAIYLPYNVTRPQGITLNSPC